MSGGQAALAGPVLAETAVAIMCMPCRRVGGHFVPTAELVLADLSGRQDPHPIHRLAERLRDRRLTNELSARDAHRVLIVFDDLAVSRSWMLPPDAPEVDTLWPNVAATAERVLDGCDRPTQVVRFSELLARNGAISAFDDLVDVHAARLHAGLSGPDGSAKQMMSNEIAHRRRFAAALGGHPPGDVRELAALQLANYAAQGHLVAAWQVAAYIPWTREEISRMAIFTPGFASTVTQASYERVPTTKAAPTADPTALVAAAIPADYQDLRSALPLYLRDLPATPGAVVPGVAADIVVAIGKLLKPGMSGAGARELAALNDVLAGGPVNRACVARLLAKIGGGDHLGWERDALPIKLFCHLASRYPDEALLEQAARNQRILAHLAARVPTAVALALTGSAAKAPEGLWHPYLSDIDVMPLRDHPPGADQAEEITAIYAQLPRPPWLYVNTGATTGYGGLTRDPTSTLFATSELGRLTAHEMAYLTGLTSRMRFLAGDQTIYDRYAEAVPARLRREDHHGQCGGDQDDR
jgi:hypothetical protein